uniref:Uncharacterized protein n=1 Tax=Oryza rufipogon TaxID=4529 RepID=A0A0E0PG17_ORYRU
MRPPSVARWLAGEGGQRGGGFCVWGEERRRRVWDKKAISLFPAQQGERVTDGRWTVYIPTYQGAEVHIAVKLPISIQSTKEGEGPCGAMILFFSTGLFSENCLGISKQLAGSKICHGGVTTIDQ